MANRHKVGMKNFISKAARSSDFCLSFVLYAYFAAISGFRTKRGYPQLILMLPPNTPTKDGGGAVYWSTGGMRTRMPLRAGKRPW